MQILSNLYKTILHTYDGMVMEWIDSEVVYVTRKVRIHSYFEIYLTYEET